MGLGTHVITDSCYKVGDMVLLKKNHKWNDIGIMDHWHNTHQVIEEVVKVDNDIRYYFRDDELGKTKRHYENHINSWVWRDDMMVLVEGKIEVKRKIKLCKSQALKLGIE